MSAVTDLSGIRIEMSKRAWLRPYQKSTCPASIRTGVENASPGAGLGSDGHRRRHGDSSRTGLAGGQDRLRHVRCILSSRLVTTRERAEKMKTTATRTNAPAQACRCQSS